MQKKLGQTDIENVKRCAQEAGFTLKRLRTNKKLELYFDLYKGKKSICSIYKGWTDPGFRISEI